MARAGVTQTTLRIKDELHERFERACRERGQKMTSVLLEAIETYVDGTAVLPKTSNQFDHAVRVDLVAHSLADAVSSYLRNNPNWASAVVESSKLGLPGDKPGFGFSGRMKHFSEEKPFLASNFLPFLRDRIWHHITKKGKKSVTLVCDSGTTLYWFLRYLPMTLKKELDAKPEGTEEWSKLRVVTNNLSGVEAFMTECALHPLRSGKLLSDIISCYVLPGKILPVYEAVTGEETNAALEKYRADADAEYGNDHVVLGLVTGNWLRVTEEQFSSDGRRIFSFPVPLARGQGHREFKQTLIRECHELYNVTPLGKLLVGHSVDDLNRVLRYTDQYRDVCDESLLEDLATREKVTAMKLVSTLRGDGQLLSNHSLLLQTALRSRHVSENSAIHVEQGFSDLPHFLYPFDWHAQKSRQEQRAIEFPHENSRTAEFARLFSVSW